MENTNANADSGAPWAKSLKWLTGFCVVILGGVAAIGLFSGPRESAIWILAMVVGPLAIHFGGAIFMIRGYTVAPGRLTIKRAGWSTRIDLGNLTAAEIDKDAMDKSLRLFGNGGLYCFAGLFRNKKLGNYRAFATDPKRSVILRFPNRTLVVTPDEPEKFVASLASSRPS